MSSHTPNIQQQQVINELDRNVLLLASAGTGKTGTLARRIANILESSRAKAEEILCLTFTNKASREIKTAIEKEVGCLARGMTIGTFHSFCFKILQEEAKSLGKFYNEITIFDEEDATVILKDLSNEIFYDCLNRFPPKNLLYMVSYFKEQRALRNIYSDNLLQDYKDTISAVVVDKNESEKIKELFSDRSIFYEKLFANFISKGAEFIYKYDKKLDENNAVDFTGLITGVAELFRSEAIIKNWQNRFAFISIDEVQDTSLLEYKVLKKLWGRNNILLAGDFFQTIYEWRGSVPFLILKEYKEEFNPVKIAFYENYRSTQCIFDASLDVLEKLFPNEIWKIYDKRPSAYNENMGAKIEVHKAKGKFDEARFIFNSILEKQLTNNEGICVLVRNNNSATTLASFFEKMNDKLPKEKRKSFLLVDQFNFYRRMEIKDVLAFLKLILNPNDVQSAKRIIKRFVSKIGEARLAELESENCRLTGLRLPDFLDLKIFEEEPYESLEEALNKGEVIVFDVESTGVDTTTDEIIQMAAIRIDKQGNILEKFERFIKPNKKVGSSEAIHGFSDEYLAENGEDPVVVFKDFLEFSAGKVVVGHNVSYDVNIFTSELYRHDLGHPKFKDVYDTLDIYRRFHPNEKKHTLEYLSEVYKTEHKPSHDAMDDIIATAELLIKALQQDIIPTKELRRSFIAKERNYFAEMAAKISTLKRKSKNEMPKELLAYIMVDIGLAAYYEKLDLKNADDSSHRVANLRELYRIFKEQEQKFIIEQNGKINPFASIELLQRVLRNSTLQNNEFKLRDNPNLIPIITVHQAKGSEFHYVYLANMQDGVFPSWMSVKNNNLKEENRLFYVAMTRAKKELVISYYEEGNKKVSRYIGLIPKQYIETN